MLEYLMRNAGRVITRERLGEHAWDNSYDAAGNVIDAYVARLLASVVIVDWSRPPFSRGSCCPQLYLALSKSKSRRAARRHEAPVAHFYSV